ncbi:MAG TPA: hypothetical protein VLM91_00475, partial [Candidatus Methylomirabilis sp.]|nr:hypothetical protein [Candidatus Methylomirabilis sp.]
KILAADGHYATYKAVGDYLGVHWRALMNARRDPRDDLNSHIILRSSLYWQPQVASKVWLPGPAFNTDFRGPKPTYNPGTPTPVLPRNTAASCW